MTVTQLTAFLAVIRTGSVTAAADELVVTGKVQDISKLRREIKVKAADGSTLKLKVAPEVAQLDKIKKGDTAEKFQNLLRRPKVTVIVDARGVGDVNKFHVSRCVVQGIASEVAKGVPPGSFIPVYLHEFYGQS